jgi:hypothetical protein
MQTDNEIGIYEAEFKEVIARHGRAYAEVRLCQCEDGLYRFSIAISYSFGGECGPIFDTSEGYPTFNAAKDAGVQKIIARIPAQSWAGDSPSCKQELKDLKTQAERYFIQPSLF